MFCLEPNRGAYYSALLSAREVLVEKIGCYQGNMLCLEPNRFTLNINQVPHGKYQVTRVTCYVIIVLRKESIVERLGSAGGY